MTEPAGPVLADHECELCESIYWTYLDTSPAGTVWIQCLVCGNAIEISRTEAADRRIRAGDARR